MDDERLKDICNLGEDYFDELVELIRNILTSEKRFYKKITDIYVTSVDYDSTAKVTQDFFARHGYTAAELIAQRAKIS